MPRSPYGTFGTAFGGATSGYRPPANPFSPANAPVGGYERDLMEEQQGRPAFGLFANAARQAGDSPYADWLSSGGTQNQLWTDYLGTFAARNDATYGLTDYLAENDPYKLYNAQSFADQGRTNPGVLSPFTALVNL